MAVAVVDVLPERLKAARLSSNLTREAVAVAIGRTHPTIVAYEVGRATPPMPVLERLAELYGVSVAALTSDDPIDPVADVVAAWPRMTDAQKDRLASLLRGGASC